MVTGAASGIGRATALTLAREGASVLCADLNIAGAQETADAIQDAGGSAAARALDVRDEQAVRYALDATVAELGALHILVNDAGIGGRNHTWDDLIEVNLNGVYYGLKHGAPAIEAFGGGSIVSLSSILGLIGIPGDGDDGKGYTASKHGVVGLTRAYALQYAARGVRVNCVNPGFVETPLTAPLWDDPDRLEQTTVRHPIGRLGQPEDIANAILFLVSEEAAFITGVALPVDGGYTAQ
jgi:NAD(P)-dependent dehydrogenase (short-subunit alcohol dehydrogenase family)